MKKLQLISSALVVSVAAQSFAFEAKANKEDAGTIIGGIIGGVIGNKFGRGGGRVGATIAGAVIGAVIGNKIGEAMDDADRRAWARAHRRCLDGNRNKTVYWRGSEYGSETGARGEFEVIREGYHVETKTVCKEYRSVIWVNGHKEVTKGYACKTKTTTESWTEVSSKKVYFAPVRPTPPPPPPVNPPPAPVPPAPVPPAPLPPKEPMISQPTQSVSLLGFCEDTDHEQFYAAKDFAINTMGLMTSEATKWALQYNETHKCQSIKSFSARYKALFHFANSVAGMMTTESKKYALEKIEKNSVKMIETKTAQYKAMFSFLNETAGKMTSESSAVSLKWISNDKCEGAEGISALKKLYVKEFKFANEGMNLMSSESGAFAMKKVKKASACGELL